MRIPLVAVVIAPLLAGCTNTLEAYWHKPTKYKEMPDKGRDPYVPVSTLSLDATRRLVISQLVPTTDASREQAHVAAVKNRTGVEPGRRFTCPEPPPDVALNTLSQALASLRTKAGTDMSAGSAYQAIVQAIHARTSTVEFWRTTSSMYCVLLMNGATAQADTYLRVAAASIGNTKDTTVTTPAAAAFIDGLIAAAEKKAADDAAKDKAKQDAADKAKKEAEDKIKAELAAAKQRCDAVPEAEKAGNADCKKVAAAAKGAAT